MEAALNRSWMLILGDRDPYNVGGYKVTTTLDWKAQQLGEKYIDAGAILPNLPASQRTTGHPQEQAGPRCRLDQRPAPV